MQYFFFSELDTTPRSSDTAESSGEWLSRKSEFSNLSKNEYGCFHRESHTRSLLDPSGPGCALPAERRSTPQKSSPQVVITEESHPMLGRTETGFLDALQRRGARRIQRVTFRRNRSTIWSISGDGTVLNLHEGYRNAPASIVDA